MEFAVLDPKTDRQIARVHLNGYSIESGGPLGRSGAMRSFTLLVGSLRSAWSNQQQLFLKIAEDKRIPIRIAALPVEEGEVGFVEFL
jgi:hypothetical protein